MYLIIPGNACTISLLTAPSQTLLLVLIRGMWGTLLLCFLAILLLNCVTLGVLSSPSLNELFLWPAMFYFYLYGFFLDSKLLEGPYLCCSKISLCNIYVLVLSVYPL